MIITLSYELILGRSKCLRDRDSKLYKYHADTRTQKQSKLSQNSQNRRFSIDFHDSLLVCHCFEHNSLIRTHLGAIQVPTRPRLEALQILRRHQDLKTITTNPKMAKTECSNFELKFQYPNTKFHTRNQITQISNSNQH